MPKHDITFTFLAPWQMGSGFGEGANLDAVPVKSPAGLPYIPGKSVKGLFREAMCLAEVESGSTDRLFGSRDPQLSRYDSTSGLLRFGSATLGTAMEAWASTIDGNGSYLNAAAIQQLYMPLAATKINSDGLAHDKSLRKIEAVLPVTLTATVEFSGSEPALGDTLKLAASLIRQAGSHRHRGLGRVSVTVQEVKP